MTQSIYIPRGITINALNRETKWDFRPAPHIKAGSRVTGGDVYGIVIENTLIEHRLMVPPKVSSKKKFDQKFLKRNFKRENTFSVLSQNIIFF